MRYIYSDKYGRLYATVFLDLLNVNEWMINNDYAVRCKKGPKRRSSENDTTINDDSLKSHRKTNSFTLPYLSNIPLDLSSSIETKKKTDCFLSHNWGDNNLNHKKIATINSALQKRGLVTWFDENEMEGNIRFKMAEGIDNTKCVIVFITDQYRNKVNGIDMKDNCKYEFSYAVNQLGPQNMIPVVMEASMRNTYDWKGELGAALGSMLYIDFVEDQLEKNFNNLCNTIINIISK